MTPSPAPLRRFAVAALLITALLLALPLSGCGKSSVDTTVSGASSSATMPSPTTTAGAASSTTLEATASGDELLADAFADRRSGIEVEGEGTVQRILSDDTEGDRHQRFIVELASGHTILVAHNIDVAPRVPGLKAGDRVAFKGEYEWSDKGGTVHWTHHDPDGGHVAGWIKYKDTTYQ